MVYFHKTLNTLGFFIAQLYQGATNQCVAARVCDHNAPGRKERCVTTRDSLAGYPGSGGKLSHDIFTYMSHAKKPLLLSIIVVG